MRQHGNLSFSRVLNAGHEVPWYEPETAYRIFSRVMADTDVATGKTGTAGSTPCSAYSSAGLDSVHGIMNEMPVHETSECYLMDQLETCTAVQTAMMKNGTAIVKDFVMLGYEAWDGKTVLY